MYLKEYKKNIDTKWGNYKGTKPLEAWPARKVGVCVWVTALGHHGVSRFREQAT